ncbi:hypothetical protein E3Q22_04220 [Wallemia mellicola]|uniref:NADH-ubiquinone oxidoreductase chain 1 n=1 Tax=Wallemia mellicola TaxID=1708541 RepID=A0A4T0NFM8_9BASI|nr:hypothetical protein E3Q24_04395 [Wallemia mellicola]TIB70342.1 hypothetical protein E3Q23_04215 [Wallemia mellicola]TIB74321.1 hypothetical protein E3Q22_04220 [Wallemia mellicola]TIB79343.1 hypothetical protein E3Q21_04165 [Wallemia mellicola]TIB82913.1 hypothetical protein E3Q20_04388 [Wallemia mellicola]
MFTLLNLIEILIVLVPVLLAVAFMTILERKIMGSMQRRVGPNRVGYYGVLQPFADALKLVVKENVIPSHSAKTLFFLAPIIVLLTSLLGWGVMPFGAGLVIGDYPLGLYFTLAIGALGIYGVLLAGWSANSKYAFIGSLRSTAQLISYELVFSSCLLSVLFLCGTLNYTRMIETQQAVWFIFPLLPLFVMYFISVLAETNRTPFDLVEAESELVSMSALTAYMFLGGYNMPELFVNDTMINIQGFILGLKTCISCILFVWFRASLPRLRYDQLMVFCWCNMLPLAIAIIMLIPSILLAFDIMPY